MLINCALPGIDQFLHNHVVYSQGLALMVLWNIRKSALPLRAVGQEMHLQYHLQWDVPMSLWWLVHVVLVDCDRMIVYFLTVCRLEDFRECWIETLMQITGSWKVLMIKWHTFVQYHSLEYISKWTRNIQLTGGREPLWPATIFQNCSKTYCWIWWVLWAHNLCVHYTLCLVL